MQAGRGAAIYSLWATYLNITGNSVFENHTVTRTLAGTIGVSDLGRSLTIDGATFRNSRCNTTSTVPPAAGGAVSAEAGTAALVPFSRVSSVPTCACLCSLARCSLCDCTQIYLERQVAENPSLPNFTATITNANFTNNRCQEAAAIYVRGVGHTIGPNVRFDNNRATLLGSAGGALYIQSLVRATRLWDSRC